MSIRTRFAPSPTGQIHIGNIRTAIFSWLFARHEGGTFLLRFEDTDRERSTPEAIQTVVEVMGWLGLDYDEAPLYQSSRCSAHLEAAERLLAEGKAYRFAKGGQGEATLFRIPWDAQDVPGVTTVGPVDWAVHPDVPVVIGGSGVSFAQPSRKGKPIPQAACLAGFRDLEVVDSRGDCLFRIEEEAEAILTGGKSFCVERAASMRFTRRQVQFHDLVKGDLAKPLDSLKDDVIVRSDGSPMFHLANVCDDLAQGVTHIVRGNDHVENTYRHVFLFRALGAEPPQYAHLPMLVNAAGKPYSKRDGDVFVGDFRDKGYLPEALFNCLALLGWSPGDDREKLTRDEMVELFTLDRVQKAPAQVDVGKLSSLNGQYMAELPLADFVQCCREAAVELPWFGEVGPAYFRNVAALMQSRTKTLADVEQWGHFAADLPEYDDKACRKFLTREGVAPALRRLLVALADVEFAAQAVEEAIHRVTDECGLGRGKLNQAIRVAVTGTTVGAGIYETLTVLGRERGLQRLRHALGTFCPSDAD